MEQILKTIEREVKKREVTYPKMAHKKFMNAFKLTDKEALTKAPIDLQKFCDALNLQLLRLKNIHYIIDNNISFLDPHSANEYLNELIREYNIRKTCYPRFIYFKRIDKETAYNELIDWQNLINYFNDKYCNQKLKYLKTKVKISPPQ